MDRKALRLIPVLSVGIVVGCASIERATDTAASSGFFYYQPYGYRGYDNAGPPPLICPSIRDDYRDLRGYHQWLEDRTRVYGNGLQGCRYPRYTGYGSSCVRCH
jgi:hypothetical protein